MPKQKSRQKRNLHPPIPREEVRAFNERTRSKPDHVQVFHFERHGKKLRCVDLESMHKRAGEQL